VSDLRKRSMAVACGVMRVGTREREVARRPVIKVPPGWRLDRGGKSLSMRLETSDFLEALDIINDVARLAEEMQHHPDFHLERWNRLRITTWSHDAGGLTKRDERLAARISRLLGERNGL